MAVALHAKNLAEGYTLRTAGPAPGPSEAAKILQRLVLEKADVVVQNLAPGAAARLGLGHDTLSRSKPALIVCDISGYGDDPERPGPYRDKKA